MERIPILGDHEIRQLDAGCCIVSADQARPVDIKAREIVHEPAALTNEPQHRKSDD